MTVHDDFAAHEFIRSDNHGCEAAMAWTKDHRQHSPYPLRHNATNIHVVGERGDELDLESSSWNLDGGGY